MLFCRRWIGSPRHTVAPDTLRITATAPSIQNHRLRDLAFLFITGNVSDFTSLDHRSGAGLTLVPACDEINVVLIDFDPATDPPGSMRCKQR